MPELLEPLSHKGKILMLAYDQGFEHGPGDFNNRNYDPNYILDIAKNGAYTCVALQYGIAAKFWQDHYENIPLVVKLNGKTNMGKEVLSMTNASVQDAVSLGAKAVGYTIYLGSEHEAEMLHQFGEIRDEAHKHNLAAFAWMYPFITQPSSNDDETKAEIVAYAARVGAEMGADVVKIKYPQEPEKLPWIIENAVGTKAILSGGDKVPEAELLEKVRNFVKAGGAGAALGRNAWQHENPVALSEKIAAVIWA